MAPQQHLVISWVLSNLNYERKRDRIITTLCGIFPDIDGLGVIMDEISGDQSYSHYLLWHRTFGHNLLAVLVAAIITFFLCKRKVMPAIIAAITYLVHIFFDLTGSAGPDGSIWPIYPLWPFSGHRVAVTWQWALNSWQNTAITAIFIFIMFAIAAKKRRSLLEIFSTRLDRYCISVFERLLARKKS